MEGRKSTATKPIFRLKHAIQKLQRRLLLSACRRNFKELNEWNEEVDSDMGMVLEGHFPVVTVGADSPPQKFFVALRYLAHPAFVRLLEEMESEFGFEQQGVLVVPCQASELQRILSLEQASGSKWNLKVQCTDMQ